MDTQKRARGRLRIYQWSEWFGRQEIELHAGKDFFCKIESFAQQVRGAASARQIRVSVFALEEKVIVWNHSYSGPSESTPDSPAGSSESPRQLSEVLV
jgi:uncharacterized protein involved in type VI secretion and phage assembly